MRLRGYTHPALTEFAAIAAEFCDLIVNAGRLSPERQLDAIHQLLPRAYAAGLRLPSTSVLFDAAESQSRASPERSSEPPVPPPDLSGLAGLLGTRRYYREIFDPYSEPTEAECIGDVTDDLGDMYRDLARGLIHWRAGNSGDALWEWRFGLEQHWGEHLTSALRAMFALCSWHDVPWPAAPGSRPGRA